MRSFWFIFILSAGRGYLAAALWLGGVAVGMGFAIATGPGPKWQILNVLIILGCTGIGLGLGYAIGLGAAKILDRSPTRPYLFR